MFKLKTRDLAICGMIAALYVVLIWAFSWCSFGWLQIRVAEALCILPFFYPPAVFGLFIGCLVSNLLFSGVWDVVLGSLTTLVAALITSQIRLKWLTPLPAIVLNALVVPLILILLGPDVTEGNTYWFMAAWVAAGQTIACAGLGLPLLLMLGKIPFIKELKSKP